MKKLPEYNASYTDRGNKRCEVIRAKDSTSGVLIVHGGACLSYRFTDDNGIIKLKRKNNSMHVASCKGEIQLYKLPHHATLHKVILSESARALREGATAVQYNIAQEHEVLYTGTDRIVSSMLEYVEAL